MFSTKYLCFLSQTNDLKLIKPDIKVVLDCGYFFISLCAMLR